VSWLQLGGSLAAILLLAAIARWLKLGESRISDPDRAMEIAEQQLAGFEATRALVATDGRAALVAGNGTVAVLKRHGARVAARRLVPPLKLEEAVEGMTVVTGERMFGRVVLFGVLAAEVRMLEAEVGPLMTVIH
jgi:hypothetical protein